MKKIICIALVSALTLGAAACAREGTAGADTAEQNGKIVVTMMYAANDLETFESLVESTYPDIDLQVERNTEATIDGETERRLRNGHGPDIVTTSMPSGEVRKYVMDLSASDFVNKYQSGIIRSTMIEGRSCFIPLPGQYYGYVYNKTLLEQNDLPVPEKMSDIMELFEKASAAGVGTGEDGALFGIGTAYLTISSYFFGTQVPDFLGLAEGVVWSDDVRERRSTFASGMQHCLDNDIEMVEKGYFSISGLNGHGNELPIEERMINGTMLMTYSNTRLYNRLTDSDSVYEYAMLPFLSDNGNEPWVIAQPDAYMAINSELSEPENAAVLDACMRIFELLSTVEGQTAIITDTGAEHSYLEGPVPHSDRVPEGIKDCVERGFIYNLRIPAKLMSYFGNRMAAVLRGEIEISDALDQVDNYYINGDEEVEYDQTLIGVAGEDLIYENYNTRREETAIGNLVADALRETSGADFSFANGGAIRGSLYKGNIFGSDLDVICPYDNDLVILETNADTIRQMLENGISGFVQENGIPAGRFLNVSGLCYSFRKPAADGSTELLSVTLPDGSPLDENKKYTIAVTSYMAGMNGYLNNNGDGYTMLNVYSTDVPAAENVKLISETGLTYSEALKAYIDAHNSEAISAEVEGRIKVVE